MRSLCLLFFCYLVASCSSNNGSSSADQASIDTGAFGAVTDISGTAKLMTDNSGNWQVEVKWKSPTSASPLAYEIHRSETTKTVPTKTLIKKYADITSDSYTIKNIPADSTQFFIINVSGTDANGNTVSFTSSEYSIKIPLDAYKVKPGSFDIDDLKVNGTEVTISWNEATNASFYIIQKGISSGSYPTTVTSLATSPYVDKDPNNLTQLNAGKTLYYMVIAVNTIGSTNANSEKNLGTGAITGTLPGAFNPVTAQAGDSQVSLTWPNSTGATSYTVQIGTSNDSFPLTFSNSATSGIVVTGLTNAQTYYFRVIAVNANGSVNADTVSATPLNLWAYGLMMNGVSSNPPEFGRVHDSESIQDNQGNLYVQMSMYGTLVDPDGQVPATKQGTIFLAKFNPTGKLVWINRVERNDSSYLMPHSLALDNTQENVYVTYNFSGSTIEDGTDISNFNEYPDDYRVVVGKFATADGSRKWLRVIQDLEQNVTVNGVPDSPVRKNCSENDPGLVSDSQNNVIIGLYCSVSGYVGGDRDTSAIVKFSPNGDILWRQDFDMGLYDTDPDPKGPIGYIAGLAIGSNDSIFIMNTDMYYRGQVKPHIVKLNSAGDPVYLKEIFGSFDFENDYSLIFNSLAVQKNPSANDIIYIAGYEDAPIFNDQTTTGSRDSFLVKYEDTGTDVNLVWTQTLGSSGKRTKATSIILDSSNHIYLAGITQGNLTDGSNNFSLTGYKDYFIAKYTDNGSTVSLQLLTQNGEQDVNFSEYDLSTLTLFNDTLTFTARVEPEGEITSFDGHLIPDDSLGIVKHSSSTGAFQGSKILTPVRYSSTTAKTKSIARDAANNLYVSGETDSKILGSPANFLGDQGAFLAKYRSDGALLWMIDIPGNGSSAIALDSSGRIYTVINNGPVARFLNDGTQDNTWTTSPVLNAFMGYQYGLVAVGSKTEENVKTEYVYIGSNDDSSVYQFPIEGGNPNWSVTTTPFTNIKANDQGDVFITGNSGWQTNVQFDGDDIGTIIGDVDAFLMKIDLDGDLAWAKEIGASGGVAYGSSIAFDKLGNVYFVGKTSSALPGNTKIGAASNNLAYAYDVFIAKYDKDGNDLWGHPLEVLGAPGTHGWSPYFQPPNSVVPQDVALDSAGSSLYITGYSEGPITGSDDNIHRAYPFLFLAKFSTSNGENEWTTQVAADNTHILNGMGLIINSTDDSIFAIGDSNRTLSGDFLNNQSDTAGFIARFDTSGQLKN